MLAIYTRLSKEDSKSTSIENQIQEGKMFAQSKNFLNYEIYNEGEGISGGATIKDRPKLDALIQDINS
jgi:DNA invertase Pin-like site-specific DNA recombinase